MTKAVDATSRAEAVHRVSKVWRELRRLRMRAVRRALYGTGGAFLEPAQGDALELIASRPTWRMHELADALGVDRSTGSRMVNRLEALGFVERFYSGEDGRGIDVETTSAGQQRGRQLAEHRVELMLRIMSEFTHEECVQLAALLERLVEGANRVATEMEREIERSDRRRP